MREIAPWATGPLELIVHAEGHLRGGDDFGRRMALIGFDNAIEVSISTYLSLHPSQCGGRTYVKADTEKWLSNYHSRLDFVQVALEERGLVWQVERPHIIWAHDHRNEQYHGGAKGTPERQLIMLIRSAAFWLFGVLFDIEDVEGLVEEQIAALDGPSPPEREPQFDRAIDAAYGVMEVGGQRYYASEILFFTDHDAYRAIGTELCDLDVDEPESAEDQAL